MSIDPALWRRHYPPGVPGEVDPDAFTSLVDMFERSTAAAGERAAVSCLGARMSFADLERQSRALAAHLQRAAGLVPGEGVALVMPNVLAYPVAIFGVLRAGGVVVNVNPRYTAREMRAQISDSGAVAAVVSETAAATLAAAGLDLRAVIVARVGDLMGVRGHAVNLAVRHLKGLVPRYALPGAVALADALRTGARAPFERVQPAGDDLAFLQYTGGTTGTAKAAMLTHRNLVANVEQCNEWFAPALDGTEEVALTALPLYHVFALTVNCLLMLRIGAECRLVLDPRDRSALLRELRRGPLTIITGVNTLFAHMLATPGFAELDLSRLRLCVAGGMAVQRPVAERWRAVTGRPLVEGYGLTEASPVVACNRLDIVDYTGAVGVPLPSTEVAVRDAGGRDLAVGREGELHFRGPQVMRGYWRRRDETAAVLGPDGFLATGDLGLIGQDGLVRVVDRLKDVIVVSGFKVYPSEVEEVATGCPGVREAACVGVPDERSGEAVVLFVAPDDARLTGETVLAHLRANLAAYKVPRAVEFRDELPKTAVGKVLRRALRDEALAG